MAKYELSSWLIGTNVPCRMELFSNGTHVNSEATPTITIYDSTGTAKVTAQNMTPEATGMYVYFADITDWAIGKCFWKATYRLSSVDRLHQAMFFVYDQEAWSHIEEIRSALDGLQEGELSSSTIYEKYLKASRWLTEEASTSVDTDLLHDAIIDEASYNSYLSYLVDRERAGAELGIGTAALLQILRDTKDRSLAKVKQATVGPGEVYRGVFRTTESSMQLAYPPVPGMDKSKYQGNKS